MLSIRALSQSFHPVFAAGSSLREKWWNAVRLRLKHATVLSVQMLYPSACARSQAIAWRKSLGLGRIPHLSSSAHAGERRFSFVPCVSYTSLHFESAMRRISLPLASCFSFLRGFFFWKKGGGMGRRFCMSGVRFFCLRVVTDITTTAWTVQHTAQSAGHRDQWGYEVMD